MIPLRNPVNLTVLSRAALDADLRGLGVGNLVSTFKASAHTSFEDFEKPTAELKRCTNGNAVGFASGDRVGASTGETRANLLAESWPFDAVA